ncbi:MAG: hypothetical protein ABI353_03020, partial [Isosphaeraceae bacterium]
VRISSISFPYLTGVCLSVSVYAPFDANWWLSHNVLVSAFILGMSQLIFAYNLFASLVVGARAGDNPWHANTLGWATTSPPPYYNYNFAMIPTVYPRSL